MMKVSDTVRQILSESEIASASLFAGYLNLSAFAKSIHEEVEKRTKKPVKLATIVVALSRVSNELKKSEPIITELSFDNITLTSTLVEVSYAKTEDMPALVKKLYSKDYIGMNDFFTITWGLRQVSIICSQKVLDQIKELFHEHKPVFEKRNLGALTVAFSEDYIDIPNQLFTILRAFAHDRINLIEVVSTYTEISIILAENDLKQGFALLDRI